MLGRSNTAAEMRRECSMRGDKYIQFLAREPCGIWILSRPRRRWENDILARLWGCNLVFNLLKWLNMWVTQHPWACKQLNGCRLQVLYQIIDYLGMRLQQISIKNAKG
jgi:hypothetical protein